MTDELFDDPNRQAVGLDPAWVEGDGGDSPIGTPQLELDERDQLDELTKDELLDVAEQRGIEANASMTKAEIKDAIEAG